MGTMINVRGGEEELVVSASDICGSNHSLSIVSPSDSSVGPIPILL